MNKYGVEEKVNDKAVNIDIVKEKNHYKIRCLIII